MFLALSLACTSEPRPSGNTRGEAEPTPGQPIVEQTGQLAPSAFEQQQAAPGVSRDAPVLAGIRWEVVEPLNWRPPSRPMRNAEYAVAGDGDREAVMTVFHFPGMGGDTQSNVDRWVGQFRAPDGSPAQASVERAQIRGLNVTTVDTQGDFSGGMASPPISDARLLAAIVEGPRGPVFFKLLGPAPLVDSAEAAFGLLVESFAPITE